MNGSLRGVPVGREPIWLAPKLPTAVKGYRHELNPLDAHCGGEREIIAAPDWLGFARLVAVITTVCEVLTVGGAEYNPAASIEPVPAGLTAHLTA